MAQNIWVADGLGGWKAGGRPNVVTATGSMPGRYVWRHNGTAWVQIWQADTTPPTPPAVALAIQSGTKNTVLVTLTTPPAPIIRTVVKVGVNKWPSNNPLDTSDGCYYTQAIPNGVGASEPWSEWWYQNPSSVYGTAGITGTKRIPDYYQTFSFPLSTPIMVSAWCQDDYFNWSSAGSNYIYTLNPDPPAPTLQGFSNYFNPIDSASWQENANAWNPASLTSHYVYQGGQYAMDGYWWYGTAPSDTMWGFNAITKLNIYIQRVNSQNGVSGGSIQRVGAHQQTSRSGGAQSLMGAWDVGTLLRGEGKWFDLGASWGTQLATGYLRGFGQGFVGYTAYTDPYYTISYGVGTSSGQLYMEWNKYV